MQLKPIRTEADYEAALEQIERLMDAEPGTSDGDRLDILTTLVEAYEAAYHPIEAPDPIAALEYFMEQRGITRADLVPLLGSRSRVSDILNRSDASPSGWPGDCSYLGIPAEAVLGAPTARRSVVRRRTSRKLHQHASSPDTGASQVPPGPFAIRCAPQPGAPPALQAGRSG